MSANGYSAGGENVFRTSRSGPHSAASNTALWVMQALWGLFIIGVGVVAILGLVFAVNALRRSNPSSGSYAVGSVLAAASTGTTWIATTTAGYFLRIHTGGDGNDVVKGTFEVTGKLGVITGGNGVYKVRVNLPIVADRNLTSSTLAGAVSVGQPGQPFELINSYITPAVSPDLLDAQAYVVLNLFSNATLLNQTLTLGGTVSYSVDGL